MNERVLLPSGLALVLERPQLRRLLWYGGALGVRQVADACLERSGKHAHELSQDDAWFVACWAAEQLDGPEALDFAALCERYGGAPSARLGIANQILAYEIDRALTAALDRYRSDDEEESEGGIAPDDPVYGFPREDAE
jgi:hypothetical protein